MAGNGDALERPEKRRNCVKTYTDDELLAGLNKLAAEDDRKLSDYIERVLRFHVFGHLAARSLQAEGPS